MLHWNSVSATALGARGDFALNKDIRLESADLLERVSDIQGKLSTQYTSKCYSLFFFSHVFPEVGSLNQ